MKKNNMIYIDEVDVPKTKTRKEFIKKILTNKGVITYSNKECTIVQCDRKEAYRSISELHEIVKARFKFTSLEALLKIIKAINDEDKCIGIVWCTQIEKVVVKYMKNTPGNYITSFSRERFYNAKGVDGKSLADYEKIMNAI